MKRALIFILLSISTLNLSATESLKNPFRLKTYTINVVGRNILYYDFVVMENNVKMKDIKVNRGHCKEWSVTKHIGKTLNYGDIIQLNELDCKEKFLEIEFITENHGSWGYN
ncbi:MAG: hypothetical protein ACPGUD_11530 [Parashewanella sp.]